MPKESQFMDISYSDHGEFQFVNYKPEGAEQSRTCKFLGNKKRSINKFWRIPSNREIMKLPSAHDLVKDKDLQELYKFETT